MENIKHAVIIVLINKPKLIFQYVCIYNSLATGFEIIVGTVPITQISGGRRITLVGEI